MRNKKQMAQAAQPTTGTTDTVVKKKRTRSSPKARPAYVIVQVLDHDGNPAPFDKKQLRIVSVERSAEAVMTAMEEGTHPNALYLRVIIPASPRAAAPRQTPALVA